MSEAWQEYVNDTRTVCKYGTKCYQKNPDHHKNFKHPPSLNKAKNITRNNRRYSPYSKDSPSPTPKKDNKIDLHTDKSETKEDVKAEAPGHSDDNINRKQSDEKLHIDLPETIINYDKSSDNNLIKDLFLVEMPNDFFKFFEFIGNLGECLEDTLASVDLEFIGPYELLLGTLPKVNNKELYLIHWRFFYDPPEFQAVIKKKKSEYHIGYFRDSPEEKPVFLASNDSAKDYHITPLAENIFGAVHIYLQNLKKKSPFTAMRCQKFMDKMKSFAEENNISLDQFDKKKRIKQSVAKTFHGAGIVVPYNKKTQLGYRRLVETDANLKKLFDKLEKATSETEKDNILSELQPAITYASIAVDECDFGTGLEIGIDLFCSGIKELEASAFSSLSAAYMLLKRDPFIKIIEMHLKHRRRGQNMSLLNLRN